HFAAQLELLAIEPVTSGKLISQCTALGYPHIAVRTVSRLGRRLDDVVLEYIGRCNPDLVIKARAGAHPVRPTTLTPNDWNLAQSCTVPLMLVGGRSWAKSPRFAAA